MIKKSEEMTKEIKKEMRGGVGETLITHFFEKGEFKGNARLVSKIVLHPGASVGYHVHENEEEIYFIIEGKALYNDNGEEKLLYSGDSSLCLSGEGHSIKNISDSEPLVLLALILTY